jgi:hypothetical protein
LVRPSVHLPCILSRHRRAPGKSEKEAIRPKYELYNDIKLLLANALSANSSSSSSSSNADGGGADSVGEQKKGAGSGGEEKLLHSESPISLEKKLLQRRLRRFESQFEATEGRKVKYHKDIASVRATYQRYKNLKRILQSE